MVSLGSLALAVFVIAGPPATPCAPPLHPRIAEALYDAVGDDTNREFVEIFNPTPAPFPLAGVRLEVGDGSGPGRWTARWTGAEGDTAPALGRFVIGGSAVTPVPDRVVDLGLQNGPDAIRLRWPDGAIEVLGYGALELPEYFCGAAAMDAPSGQSLARTPDDADLGSNALDFRADQLGERSPSMPGEAGRVLPTWPRRRASRSTHVMRARSLSAVDSAIRWGGPPYFAPDLSRSSCCRSARRLHRTLRCS